MLRKIPGVKRLFGSYQRNENKKMRLPPKGKGSRKAANKRFCLPHEKITEGGASPQQMDGLLCNGVWCKIDKNVLQRNYFGIAEGDLRVS